LSRTSVASLDAAIAKLDGDFPNIVELRHAVGHDADTSFSLDQRAKHAINGEAFTDLLLGGNLQGRKLIYGREGKIISLLIADNETEKLQAVADLTCSAFK
jgi:hypothetical protein